MLTEAEDFLEEIALLDNCFTDGYQYVARFGRDEQDDFSVELSVCTNSNSEISRGSVRPITPIGELKREVLGWRSFFGVPLKIKESLFIAVGVQKAVEHVPLSGYRSRGCYLTSKALIYELSDDNLKKLSRNFQTLKGRIEKSIENSIKPLACPVPISNIYKIKSSSPQEHLYEEVRTISWALEYMTRQTPEFPLFRTLAFSQDELAQASERVVARAILVPGKTSTSIPEFEPLVPLENFIYKLSEAFSSIFEKDTPKS